MFAGQRCSAFLCAFKCRRAFLSMYVPLEHHLIVVLNRGPLLSPGIFHGHLLVYGFVEKRVCVCICLDLGMLHMRRAYAWLRW